MSSIHNAYLEDGSLRVEELNRGVTWIDAGTVDSLLMASNFISNIEKIFDKQNTLDMHLVEFVFNNFAYFTSFINSSSAPKSVKRTFDSCSSSASFLALAPLAQKSTTLPI